MSIRKVSVLFTFAIAMILGSIPVTNAQTAVKVKHEDLSKVPYQIVDSKGVTYSYKTKLEYMAAEKKFKDKWSKESKVISPQASDYATEMYEHANFGGWKYNLPLGYYVNFNTSIYNDNVSSLKTARRSSGTKVCYHWGGGEPCKTFAPGQDYTYVGDGWNDQISYAQVYY